MDNKKALGNRINAALAIRDKKQKELAHAIGVTDNTISYFCNGKRVPNFEQIIAIAKALDVSTDYLLGLSETPSTDKDIQAVCKFTGLSTKAVATLNKADSDELDLISFLIENRISSGISSTAYGCAIDKSMIIALDKKYSTVGLSKDVVLKMIRESDDVREAFNEVKRLEERVDMRLWRCHKTLESAIESFIDHVLEEGEKDGQH